MADAARALEIPVISGNVSLYNENEGEAIWPTPVVGCVGLIEDSESVVPMGFQREGDTVLLVSAPSGGATKRSLSGSEYLRARTGLTAGKLELDLHAATRLQRFLLEASSLGSLSSAHDVGAGGLAASVAESCIAGGIGIAGSDMSAAGPGALFGEPQSHVVLSCSPGRTESELQVLATAHGLRAQPLGRVGGDRLQLAGIDVSLAEMRAAYESGLPRALEGVTANS